MRSGFKYILLILLLIMVTGDLYASRRRMLGPDLTMSWASSYLSIESGSVIVQNNATWTYATAGGFFFDYMINPYISFRGNWFFYPSSLNSKLDDLSESAGEIPLHEIGFSVLRHYNVQPLNPWFGVGPYVQFASVNDLNSYILHALISIGFDYELVDDTFLCPMLMSGIGARIISSNADTVQIDVPTGKDFTSSGIVIFFKLGVGMSF